jgi:hypothetical protein
MGWPDFAYPACVRKSLRISADPGDRFLQLG